MTKNSNLKYFLAMFAAMISWGVAWTVGKIAVEHSNPEICSFWRYFITFFTIIPIIIWLKVPLKISKRGVFLMLCGGVLTAAFNYSFFTAVSYGNAGYGGALVTSISPIFTYFASIFAFKIKINKNQIIALVIGLIGAIILMRLPFDGFDIFNESLIYFLLCAILWTFVTIIAQMAAKTAHPMFYVTGVFGITMCLNYLLAHPYHPFNISSFDSTYWLAITFTGLISGTFGMAMYFLSAAKVGAHNASVFMFIVPIGAIVSSYIIYKEEILISTIIGCVLAFCAVLLFNTKKQLLAK